jgi:TRAP transporter TAXI family solute receptor
MSRRIQFRLLFLLICIASLPSAARAGLEHGCEKVDPGHRLLTGDHGLNSNEVGQAIAKAFNKDRDPRDQLVACVTDGSIDNVRLLAQHQAEFAIVQSDVAHSAWYGHPLHTVTLSPSCVVSLPPDFPANLNHLLLIAPLFTSAVHVLVRPHLYISSIADLRGKHVWAGKELAGGYLTAERVLAAAGLGMCDVKLVHFTNRDPNIDDDTVQTALDKLRKMELDAVFFTGSAPTTAVQAAFAPQADARTLNSEISFLPLSVGMVTELSRDSSYVETMIRKDEYGSGNPGDQGVATVGVEALLVASDEQANSAIAQSLVNFLAGNMDKVRRYIPSDEKALTRLSLVDAPTPVYLTRDFFLPLAISDFYKDRSSFWRRAILWTIGIVVALFVLFCWKRKAIGPRIMKEPGAFFAFLGILIAWAAGSFTLWAYERHVNGDFATIVRSLRSLALYILPWIARTPVTSNGQSTATIVRYILAGLFLGAIWPFAKKFLVERIWRPVARWLRGGHLFTQHNH